MVIKTVFLSKVLRGSVHKPTSIFLSENISTGSILQMGGELLHKSMHVQIDMHLFWIGMPNIFVDMVINGKCAMNGLGMTCP